MILRIMPYLKEDVVSIAQTHGEMHIRSGNMIVSMRLLEQHFPDISKAVPIHPYQEAYLPRVAVIEALKRIKLVSADTRTIKVTFKAPSTLVISGQSQAGEGEEVFDIKTTANTEIYFGIDSLTKSLERFAEETVLLQIRSPKDALVIREGNYVNVIIPRLR
jgi:DNA polymerase III sliding clamp (beta) subunit (PCNA family)